MLYLCWQEQLHWHSPISVSCVSLSRAQLWRLQHQLRRLCMVWRRRRRRRFRCLGPTRRANLWWIPDFWYRTCAASSTPQGGCREQVAASRWRSTVTPFRSPISLLSCPLPVLYSLNLISCFSNNAGNFLRFFFLVNTKLKIFVSCAWFFFSPKCLFDADSVIQFISFVGISVSALSLIEWLLHGGPVFSPKWSLSDLAQLTVTVKLNLLGN